MFLHVAVAWADPTRDDAIAALWAVQRGLARFDYEAVEARVLQGPERTRAERREDLVHYALEGRLSAAAVEALAAGEWAPARTLLPDAALADLTPLGTDPARVWLLTRGAAAVAFVDGDVLRVARLEHVEVLAPPSPARAALPPPSPGPAPPSGRAAAVALLLQLHTLLEDPVGPAAEALVLAPPGAAPGEVARGLAQLRALGELDEQGVRLLGVHGVWGPAADVVEPALVTRRAALLGVPVDAVWALALGDARALFVDDGTTLRLAYVDDVGTLGRDLGLLPLGTPGVYEALALVETARGRPWTDPIPRWGAATDLLGPGGARDLALRHGVWEREILVLGTQPPLAFRWDGATLSLLDRWKAGMGG